MARGVFTDMERDELGHAWWELEKAENIHGLMKLMSDFGSRNA